MKPWLGAPLLICILLSILLIGCQSGISEEERAELMVAAMLEHPAYQTTPEEECATLILMAVAASGDYTLPLDSEVDDLCEWYASQLE